ncbi:MAG TPA: MerR family transcriptional regulator [Methylomusa anaerophila]|uniref:HTH-type transcriptional regulator AdhR n=1 Tax=Methylomusa anaerophila TaxID=1930071 RepID=A0A348AN50_9FIRM|nr:MerR family transcriptional regulator [Methylomusa anaerophila]BBB92498.1 HTH-type transcriptional regulator AdhR [Methylomusa anaerophila]HML87650.1 MerR family transcriptional regulator [Methylomusa anaerophila]
MTISEVSQKFDISQDTLRYYERVGLIPRVNRNKSGNRDYTEEDCNWVEFIKCMRDAGLTVEVLIKYVALFQKGEETVEERKKLLIEQRQLLQKRTEEMLDTLKRLDYKIECLIVTRNNNKEIGACMPKKY